MHLFEHNFKVKSSLQKVIKFHKNTKNLNELTPPLCWIKFHKIEPVSEKSMIIFTLWLLFIPVKWTAMHINVDNKGFTDVQVRGPFKSWKHIHTFIEINDNLTLISDKIYFELNNKGLNFIISVFIWISLPLLFFYRKLKTVILLKK